MTQLVSSLTDTSFDDVINEHSGLILVDFWAPWCGPCKSLAPLLEELAADYEGQLRIVKINADEHKLKSQQFTVRSLPTLILFNAGVEQDRILGLTSKSRLAAVIEQYLED